MSVKQKKKSKPDLQWRISNEKNEWIQHVVKRLKLGIKSLPKYMYRIIQYNTECAVLFYNLEQTQMCLV